MVGTNDLVPPQSTEHLYRVKSSRAREIISRSGVRCVLGERSGVRGKGKPGAPG